jgi:hypothetical protein
MAGSAHQARGGRRSGGNSAIGIAAAQAAAANSPTGAGWTAPPATSINADNNYLMKPFSILSETSN